MSFVSTTVVTKVRELLNFAHTCKNAKVGKYVRKRRFPEKGGAGTICAYKQNSSRQSHVDRS